jgi:hypothetical protein
VASKRIVAIGGSDAGTSAALRARELDPDSEVTVVVADAYPNFSICGIPYYVSGEVGHWSDLAHRTLADLKATGMQVRTDTLATGIDVPGKRLAVRDAEGRTEELPYDALIVGTGAVSVRPPIEGLSGPDGLGPQDGVHLVHSMGDTFGIMQSLAARRPKSAVVIGAGCIHGSADRSRPSESSAPASAITTAPGAMSSSLSATARTSGQVLLAARVRRLGKDLATQSDAVGADPHVRSGDQAALLAFRVAAEGATSLGVRAGLAAGAAAEGGAGDVDVRSPPDGVSQPVPARYQHLRLFLKPEDVVIAAGHESPRRLG